MLSFPLGRDVLVLQLQRAAVLRWPQVIPLWMTTELLNSLVALKKTANCERMIYSLWRMFFLVTVLPACPFLFVQYRTSNAALQPIAYSCFTLVSIKMPCNNSLQELHYAAIFWQLLYHEMSLPDLLEDSVAIVIEFSCLNSLQYRSIMQKVPITQRTVL